PRAVERDGGRGSAAGADLGRGGQVDSVVIATAADAPVAGDVDGPADAAVHPRVGYVQVNAVVVRGSRSTGSEEGDVAGRTRIADDAAAEEVDAVGTGGSGDALPAQGDCPHPRVDAAAAEKDACFFRVAARAHADGGGGQ